MRHFYICSGDSSLSTPINTLHLIPAESLDSHSEAWNITVPDDMHIADSGYGYFCTEDSRTLRQLSAMPIVKVFGKWSPFPALIAFPINVWREKLAIAGYMPPVHEAVGYIPKATWNAFLAKTVAAYIRPSRHSMAS